MANVHPAGTPANPPFARRKAVANLGVWESRLSGDAVDVAVDDSAGSDEGLLQALDLERLLGGLVSPLQLEAAGVRLSAVRVDGNAVLALDRLFDSRPFRRVDTGVGQRVTCHTPKSTF